MKKQNFIKSSVILMISAIVAKAFGALFKIPLTNILGGVGMSYFSCAYSLFMPVYALTVTGLSAAVARMVAKSMAFGMYGNINRIRKTALFLFSAVGIIGTFLIIVFAEPFSIFSSGNKESSLAVIMIAPTVFFGCVTAVERGYYEGMSNMYPTALSQAAEGIIKVLAGLWLCGYVNRNGSVIIKYFPETTDIRALSAAAGILGVTLSSFGALVFFAVLSLFRKKYKDTENNLMTYREISKELVSTALPTGISAVVTNLTAVIDMFTIIGCISYFGCNMKIPHGIAQNDIPNFIYGSFAGIALTVFNLVPSVTNMLGKGILPCITEAWEEGNSENLKYYTWQALMTSFIISVPCAVGIGVLAPEILHFLFSRQSEEVEICINPLRLLMPGMVFLCVSFPLFSMLQAIGKSSEPLKIMIVGTIIKLIGNIALIPFMSAGGAGLSTTICYAVILVISVYVYFSSTGITINIYPFVSVLYSGILCGMTAYLVSDLCRKYGAENIISLFLSVISGGAVYIISLYLLSFRKYIKNFRKSRAI